MKELLEPSLKIFLDKDPFYTYLNSVYEQSIYFRVYAQLYFSQLGRVQIPTYSTICHLSSLGNI